MDELQSFNIRAGAVLLDLDYIFPGDEVGAPKWIVVLSNNLINENIIFTLTTSQVKTYTGSFRHFLLVKQSDEQCFEKDCIIEIERTQFIDVEIILNKYKSKRIIHKGFISEKLLNRIFDEIAECPAIPEYIKEDIGVYDGE
jgi:hypothetical protein